MNRCSRSSFADSLLKGVCIFTAGALDAPNEKRDANIVPEVYFSVLGIPRTLEVLAECDCVCRYLEYDQDADLHLYIIAQKRAEE